MWNYSPSSNSDHLGLSLAVFVITTKCNPKRSGRNVWAYAYANFEFAQEMLDAVNCSSLFESTDVNDCWSIWHANFMQVMEACIPQSVLKARKARKNLLWLTKPYVQAMRKRNSYFCAAKRSKYNLLWNKYKSIRNKVVALLRRGKRQCFYNLQSSTTKEFRKVIKVIN